MFAFFISLLLAAFAAQRPGRCYYAACAKMASSVRHSEGSRLYCLAVSWQPIGKQESHESRGWERDAFYLCKVITMAGRRMKEDRGLDI